MHVQLRSLKGVVRRHPEDGARRGVLRQRLAPAAPGGTGPRPPGTTTRTRGARCDRSGARRSASLGELLVREARDRSLKSPRWSAGRRASPVWDARRLVRRLACRGTCRPNGCLASTRRLSALRHPFAGVSEATKQNPGAKTRRGNESGCLTSEYGFAATLVLIQRSA